MSISIPESESRLMVRIEFHEFIVNLNNYGVLEINSNNFNSYCNAYVSR